MMMGTKGWCWNLNSLLTSDSGSPPTHVFCSSLGFKIGKFGLIKSLRFGLVKSKNSPILSRSDFCASSHPGVHPHMSCSVLLEEANRVTNRGFPLVEHLVCRAPIGRPVQLLRVSSQVAGYRALLVCDPSLPWSELSLSCLFFSARNFSDFSSGHAKLRFRW